MSTASTLQDAATSFSALAAGERLRACLQHAFARDEVRPRSLRHDVEVGLASRREGVGVRSGSGAHRR